MRYVIDFIKKNKAVNIIYKIFKLIVITVLMLYVSFVIYQKSTDNADLFGYRIFTVATGSMEPVYNVNDVILVKSINPEDLKIGDDVAYLGNRAGLEGLIITHRIIRIEESNSGKQIIFTKGVANESEDPAITGEQVLGKVEGKVLFINTLNHIVKSSWGFFFLIFLPLVLVIILELFETLFEKEEEKRLYSDDDDDDEEDDDDDEEEVIIVKRKKKVIDEEEILEDYSDKSLEDDILDAIEDTPTIGKSGEEEDEEII